jgi:hypothetical protein
VIRGRQSDSRGRTAHYVNLAVRAGSGSVGFDLFDGNPGLNSIDDSNSFGTSGS